LIVRCLRARQHFAKRIDGTRVVARQSGGIPQLAEQANFSSRLADVFSQAQAFGQKTDGLTRIIHFHCCTAEIFQSVHLASAVACRPVAGQGLLPECDRFLTMTLLKRDHCPIHLVIRLFDICLSQGRQACEESRQPGHYRERKTASRSGARHVRIPFRSIYWIHARRLGGSKEPTEPDQT
jgi:hypothetical protein